MNDIKPIWENPYEWEDYKNGMFGSQKRDAVIKQCYEVLRKNCYFEMTEMLNNYKKSARVNLRKRVWNNQAWVGQATCNYYFGATISETTTAWGLLTKKEKDYANKIADEVVKEWLNENK